MDILSQELYNNLNYYEQMNYTYKVNTNNLEIGNLIVSEYYSHEHDTNGNKNFSYKRETMFISNIINDMFNITIKCYPVIEIDKNRQIAHLINAEYTYRLVGDNWYQIYEDEELDTNDYYKITPVNSEIFKNINNLKRTYVSDSFISEYTGMRINGLVKADKFLTNITYDNIPIWCNKY